MKPGFNQKHLEQHIGILQAELQMMREALKTSEKNLSDYRQIVENANSAVIIMSMNGKVEYLNPFAERIYGVLDKSGNTDTIYQDIFIKKKDKKSSIKEMLGLLQKSDQNIFNHEKLIKIADGNSFWISWTIRLLFDENQQPYRFIAIGADISKRKLAEDAMRESEYNLTKAQEVAKIGSWAWEIDTDNIHCSSYFLKIFGVHPVTSYKQLLVQLEGIIFQEYRNYINTKIAHATERGTTESFTYRISHPSGESRWIMEEVSLLGDIGKKKQMLIGTVRDITEQKAAEDKLKEYLLIVSSSSELMSLIDRHYRYINVNQAYLDAYGKNSHEIEGHTVEEMFGHKTFQEIIKPNIDKCLLGEHLTDQYWFDFPNGQKCFLDVKYNPVLEVDGTISGVTVSARDITDLKEVEEQLNIFKLFAEESGVGFGMANLDGEITYLNSRLSSMAGYADTSALLGKNILDSYLGNHKDKLFNEILPTIKRKGQYTGEIDLVRKDGIVIHTIENFFIIRNAEGEAVSFALTVTDITDRKLAEKALQQSENNFRAIFTNAAIGIDVVDKHGNFIQVNKAMSDMMGYTADELKKLSVADVTYADDREISKNPLEDLFHGKKDFYRIEKRYLRKNGEIFWADLSVTDFHDVINDQKLAIGTIIDINDSKRLEEELRKSREEAIKANMAKSEFLANMSHEIRTPLNAVIGFTELLETMVSDTRQINYLQSIKSGGKNLLMLINDILDLSKIEAGKLEFKFEALNPYFLIDEIKQIFSIKIAEKDIDFIVEVQDDIPGSLILDEVRLRQVIFNLIGNAIKFTENGYVKFSVRKLISKGDTSKIDLIIDVEDTGIGIPENQHDRIFDAFQQQSGQSTRKYGGTGLGLSISKRLVEMMGGVISLKSVVGKGSVFSFTLKGVSIGAALEDIAREDSLNVDGITFEPAKIMIVDDVESNRRIISENFASRNLRMVEAEDGHKAVLLASQFLPNVIFMDIRMPVMDGFEAARLIKTRNTTKSIKIIALTASVRSEDQDEDYQKYFDGYLKKPVTRVELFRELMRFLKYKEIKQILPEIPEIKSGEPGEFQIKISPNQARNLI
ncbi:MAG: PAS domain S-box protein, partial [Bacteroidales bacterium]|nr:PAS domain S-box protein [Bacteroidales bacterium]